MTLTFDRWEMLDGSLYALINALPRYTDTNREGQGRIWYEPKSGIVHKSLWRYEYLDTQLIVHTRLIEGLDANAFEGKDDQ